jgi:hypothetical protein
MSLYYLVRVLFDGALFQHDHSIWTLGFLWLAAWGLRRSLRPRFRRQTPRNGHRPPRKRPQKCHIDGAAPGRSVNLTTLASLPLPIS